MIILYIAMLIFAALHSYLNNIILLYISNLSYNVLTLCDNCRVHRNPLFLLQFVLLFIFICKLSNATKSVVVNVNPSANIAHKFIL